MAFQAHLRRNFLWTLAGNGIYGVSQWAVLGLIAKLGSAEMLGRYALAVAIATPPMMLGHLNLRAVLATAASSEHGFAQYLTVRHWMSGACLLAVACLAFVSPAPILTFLVGLSLAAESESDLYFGALQKGERMDAIAISMIVRGLGSMALVAAALAFTRDLTVAAGALCTVRLLLLFAYDRRRAGPETEGQGGAGTTCWPILRKALPLGAVLMLVSLTANLPRYAIEKRLGTEALGAFAAVASFIAFGYLMTNALGQSTMPRLARLYEARDFSSFRSLAVTTTLMGGAVGLAGVIASTLLGAQVLALLYRPEFVIYAPVLVATMAASVFLFTANTLGYVNTSTRKFDSQLPLFALSAAVCFIASEVFVARHGLTGAAMALASAATVQVLGHVFILSRSLREAAPR